MDDLCLAQPGQASAHQGRRKNHGSGIGACESNSGWREVASTLTHRRQEIMVMDVAKGSGGLRAQFVDSLRVKRFSLETTSGRQSVTC
jgi:hypothetical protein